MKYEALPELLLVEDCESDEMMSLAGIAESGIKCNVVVRRDGAEALDHLLDADKPLPALVLLDYRLPKLNGLEVLSQVRKSEKAKLVPVVVFSGSVEGGALDDCYGCGANSCVHKPADPTEYLNQLSQITRYWLTVNLHREHRA